MDTTAILNTTATALVSNSSADLAGLANLGLLVLAVLGAILLYFGKVIGDAQAAKYDRLSYYTAGTLFTIIFGYLPACIIYLLYAKWGLFWTVSAQWIWTAIVLQIVLVYLLYYGVQRKLSHKYDLDEEIKRRLQAALSEVYKKNPTLKQLATENPVKDSTKTTMRIFNWLGSNSFTLLTAVVTVYLTVAVFISAPLYLLLISLLATFVSFTMLAALHGFDTYYPPSTIILKNGDTICGRVLKYGDFLEVLTAADKRFINSAEVAQIIQARTKVPESLSSIATTLPVSNASPRQSTPKRKAERVSVAKQ